MIDTSVGSNFHSSDSNLQNAPTSRINNFNDIPQHIWEILPDSAMYLKEIMIFCGYESITSIMKLESEEERKKMFQFVVMMKDAVGDPKKMFGIFASVPEKVMVLPGLVPVFDEFIQNVKKLKSTVTPIQLGTERSKTQKIRVNKVVVISNITAEDVVKQMEVWFRKQKVTQKFNVTSIAGTNSFQYTCLECKWKKLIPVDANGKTFLSNVQRHYRSKRCDSLKKKTTATASQASNLQNFFPRDETHAFASSSSPTGVVKSDQRSHSLDVQFENHSWKESLPETTNKETEKEETNPKNLLPPAGHLGNTELSGR